MASGLMKYYGEEMTSAVHYVFTSTEATIDKFEVEQELLYLRLLDEDGTKEGDRIVQALPLSLWSSQLK